MLREDCGEVLSDEIQKTAIRVVTDSNIVITEVILVFGLFRKFGIGAGEELVVGLVDYDTACV